MGDPLRHWNQEPATSVRSIVNDAPTVRPPAQLPFESRIPVLTVDPAQLRQLPLDKHTGFLLSLMDGKTTVETVLDLCCMPADKALQLLSGLIQQGIVALE